jgi:uncharacterized protein (DUF488 family)
MTSLLIEAGVQVLIDVREYPLSRKKNLSKTSLSDLLGQYGIRYIHAKFAGNPKRFRDAAESYEQCLNMYEEYLEANPDITETFRDLVSQHLQDDKSLCLMCYERHPLDCHRSILLRHSSINAEIQHLGETGADRFTQREEHRGA